nr:Methanol O-anthraniloyltransferase [Ipomoea batatas]
MICGGFIVAIRVNHVLSDGLGLAQFVKAVGEFAQGASSPSIIPVWRRQLLTAKHVPLRTTYDQTQYRHEIDATTMDHQNLVSGSFFFGPKEMKALRQKLPPSQTQPTSKFDLITASIWICRTRALEFAGDETVAVICTMNARDKGPLELRHGYYGNAVVFPTAVAKAGRPAFLRSRSCFIATDLSRLGFDEMDFGWGNPVYGGTMDGGASATAITHARYRNSGGEDGVVVPVFLPPAAMKRFEAEMKKLIAFEPREVIEIQCKSPLKSAL